MCVCRMHVDEIYDFLYKHESMLCIQEKKKFYENNDDGISDEKMRNFRNEMIILEK